MEWRVTGMRSGIFAPLYAVGPVAEQGFECIVSGPISRLSQPIRSRLVKHFADAVACLHPFASRFSRPRTHHFTFRGMGAAPLPCAQLERPLIAGVRI